MAKAKSANATKTSSASPSGRKRPASGEASASAKKSADTQREISDVQIGHVAGQVWSLLSSNGGQSLADIKKSVDAPADLILAAIGWLAREEKLEFSKSGRTVKISLR